MNIRAEHTRSLLQSALLGLAEHRQLEEVTVREIVEAAGVNRSSFYQHYDDKYTLLADALEATIDEIVPGSVPAEDIPAGTIPPQLWRYLEHVADQVGVYRQVLGEHGSTVVAARLAGRIARVLEEVIAEKTSDLPADLPARVLAASAVGSLIGVLSVWVSEDPPQPVEVAARWIEAALITPADSWLLPREPDRTT